MINWDFFPGMQHWFNILKSTNIIYHVARIQDKNYLIILVNLEKAFDDLQYPIIIKICNKLNRHFSKEISNGQ